MHKYALFISAILLTPALFAQTKLSENNILKEVKIETDQRFIIDSVKQGQKLDIIRLKNIPFNVGTNNTRQVFAKVAGMHIVESDGSNIQMSLASRGLSFNRSWEFNMQQNGLEIAADPIGYPEAYFTTPAEALEKVTVSRGSDGIQYGTQFGGAINFITERATLKKFEFKNNSTLMSFNGISQYNKISGTLDKFTYNIIHQFRKSETFRDNNAYHNNYTYANFQYKFNEHLTTSIELTHNDFLCQQPGGLTDSLLSVDPSASLRNRNWMNIKWFLPSLNILYSINSNNQIQFKYYNSIGQRNSIGFLKAINLKDDNSNRQIDIDNYTNYTAELMMTNQFKTAAINHHLQTKLKMYNGNTLRLANGKGDKLETFNLNLLEDFARKYDLHAQQYALSIQDEIQFNKITIKPSVRLDYINASIEGTNAGKAQAKIDKDRILVNGGINFDYKIDAHQHIYSNISSNYRPVLFSDIIPPSTTDSIDPNLKDIKGFTSELGYQYNHHLFNIECTIFAIDYANRSGNMLILNNLNQSRVLRTNIGNSLHLGLELVTEIKLFSALKIQDKLGELKISNSFAYTNASYYNTSAYSTSNNKDITTTDLSGNKVENAPNIINRVQLNYSYKKIEIGFNHNFVGETFTDAANTAVSNASSQIGLLPAYQIIDLALKLHINKSISFNGGCNNLLNAFYATRRAGGYPGPGIMPGETRNFYFGISFKV